MIFTYRYLESETYKVNHRANRIVVSEFGTVGIPDPCISLFGKFNALFVPTLNKVLSDNCVVNVLQVKDELVAMTETNFIRSVDPETLATHPERVSLSFIVHILDIFINVFNLSLSKNDRLTSQITSLSNELPPILMLLLMGLFTILLLPLKEGRLDMPSSAYLRAKSKTQK